MYGSDSKPKKKMKKKGVLTAKQKEMLEKHKAHHTAKHMAMMRKLMKEGKSFSMAHKETQKKVGK